MVVRLLIIRSVIKWSFVKYPSQAGAFFQWGLPDSTHLEPYFRQAYHPVNPVIASYWNKTLQF